MSILKRFDAIDPDSVRINILYGCEGLIDKFPEEDMKATTVDRIIQKFPDTRYLNNSCNLFVSKNDNGILKNILDLNPTFVVFFNKDTLNKETINLFNNYIFYKTIGTMTIMRKMYTNRYNLPQGLKGG
jgi:hypothetical protein